MAENEVEALLMSGDKAVAHGMWEVVPRSLLYTTRGVQSELLHFTAQNSGPDTGGRHTSLSAVANYQYVPWASLCIETLKKVTGTC